MDCLSANKIKEFVPYFNQYTIMKKSLSYIHFRPLTKSLGNNCTLLHVLTWFLKLINLQDWLQHSIIKEVKEIK